MIVVIANHLPDAVRGRMKLWFLEPKPNVFVSGIKDSLADEVIDYLFESCDFESGLVVFKSEKKAPGFKIYTKGHTSKKLTSITGFQLIIESIRNTQNI